MAVGRLLNIEDDVGHLVWLEAVVKSDRSAAITPHKLTENLIGEKGTDSINALIS